MTNDENNNATNAASSVALLTRTHQITIAVLLAIALVATFATLLWRTLIGDEVVDIDRSESRRVEFRIDINAADWPEFSLLPGVGETLARRIVASRKTEGRFPTHSDLVRVRGIGPKKLKAIRPYLLPIDTHQVADPSEMPEE